MRRRMALWAALGVMTLALGSQLLLPPLAEDRIREKLEPLGAPTSVEISAAPALKLLGGHVDHAGIVMDTARLRPGELDPEMLDNAANVDLVSAKVGRLRAGPLDVERLSVLKDGDRVEADGSLALADLSELVPGAEVSIDDGSVLLELSANGLPLPFPVRLEIAAEDGKVVARPRGEAAALLPTQSLLDRPELAVEDLNAEIHGPWLRMSATGRLTGA